MHLHWEHIVWSKTMRYVKWVEVLIEQTGGYKRGDFSPSPSALQGGVVKLNVVLTVRRTSLRRRSLQRLCGTFLALCREKSRDRLLPGELHPMTVWQALLPMGSRCKAFGKAHASFREYD